VNRNDQADGRNAHEDDAAGRFLLDEIP